MKMNVDKGIERYKRLCEASENDLYQISELFIPYNDSGWNGPMNYRKMFSFITALAFDDGENYEKFLTTVEKRDKDKIFEELKDKNLWNGFSIAEIGGYGLDIAAEKMGAEIVSACAEGNSSYVNLDNYIKLFPAEYDISLSSNLFDYGSWISDTRTYMETLKNAIIKGRFDISFLDYFNVDYEATKEMLAVFSNITKEGGCSIHDGVGIEVQKNILDFFGFEKKYSEEGIFSRQRLIVFQKTEPKPDLFPEGLECGSQRIVFDKEKKKIILV